MALDCCGCYVADQPVGRSKHIDWMKNLPPNLHAEPISKLAIPGKISSFKFEQSKFFQEFKYCLYFTILSSVTQR